MLTAVGVLRRRWDLRSYLRYLSPHAIGHTPGPHQVHLPFFFPDDSGLLPKIRGSACIPAQRGLSLNQTLPVISVRSTFTKLHHSLYATACGFGKHPRLGKTSISASRLGTVSGQVRPVCYHTNPPPAYISVKSN